MNMHPDAVARLVDWLAKQPDTEGKRAARVVADKWDTEGYDSAIGYFRAYAKEKRLVQWEQLAIADMVTAMRAQTTDETASNAARPHTVNPPFGH